MAKGISSKPILVPCCAASAHSEANASTKRDIGHFSRKKSPTFMCLALSTSAALKRFCLQASDFLFRSPSRNQSVKNSSSTCLMPLSSRDLLHLWKASCLQNVIQIRVPNSETGEPGSGRGLYPVTEIERAVFSVGVWDTSG